MALLFRRGDATVIVSSSMMLVLLDEKPPPPPRGDCSRTVEWRGDNNALWGALHFSSPLRVYVEENAVTIRAFFGAEACGYLINTEGRGKKIGVFCVGIFDRGRWWRYCSPFGDDIVYSYRGVFKFEAERRRYGADVLYRYPREEKEWRRLLEATGGVVYVKTPFASWSDLRVRLVDTSPVIVDPLGVTFFVSYRCVIDRYVCPRPQSLRLLMHVREGNVTYRAVTTDYALYTSRIDHAFCYIRSRWFGEKMTVEFELQRWDGSRWVTDDSRTITVEKPRYGYIYVYVYDASSRTPIPVAHVVVLDARGGKVAEGYTDIDGRVMFRVDIHGEREVFTVRAEHPNYLPAEATVTVERAGRAYVKLYLKERPSGGGEEKPSMRSLMLAAASLLVGGVIALSSRV